MSLYVALLKTVKIEGFEEWAFYFPLPAFPWEIASSAWLAEFAVGIDPTAPVLDATFRISLDPDLS